MKVLLHLRQKRTDLGALADVGLIGVKFPVKDSYLPLGVTARKGEGRGYSNDVGTSFGQPHRHALPDVAAASRDEGLLAGEAESRDKSTHLGQRVWDFEK